MTDLAHYGVPGMKWGVRKNSNKKPSIRKETYERLKAKTPISVKKVAKNGKEISLEEVPWSNSVLLMNTLTARGRFRMENNKRFALKVDGEEVGDAFIEKKKNGSIYLNWLGVNSDHEGNGYGSAAFSAAIEYGKNVGATKLYLEVPGISPNAKHIYEKQGFKDDGPIQKSPYFGGLQPMSLDLKNDSINHSDSIDELDEAIRETFILIQTDNADGVETTDLAHYGVPGMKWGRRKNTSAVGSENSRRKKVLTGIAVGVGAAAIGTGVYFVSKKYGLNISKISKSAPQLIQGKKLITSELKKNVPKLDPKRDKELIDFLKNTSSRVAADNAAFRAKAKEQLKDAHLLDQKTRAELAAIIRGERDYVNG